MSDASTSAAPADAGPTNDQVSQPDDNSVVDHENTTRQDRGAAPSKSTDKPKATAKADSKSSASSAADDPEWDLGNGRKAKRSEVVKRLTDTQRGAQKANEEAKQYRAKVEKLDAALKKHGLDPDALEDDEKSQALLDKIAEERMARKFEDAALDPKERELRQLKAENERLAKERADHDAEQQKQEHTRKVQETFDKIAERFSTALGEAGLPRDPYTVSVMAALARGARKANQQISVSELTSLTAKRIEAFVEHALPAGEADGDGEALARRLGPKRVEALLKHERQKHADKFEGFQAPKPKTDTSLRQAPRRVGSGKGYHTLDEWNRTHGRVGR